MLLIGKWEMSLIELHALAYRNIREKESSSPHLSRYSPLSCSSSESSKLAKLYLSSTWRKKEKVSKWVDE